MRKRSTARDLAVFSVSRANIEGELSELERQIGMGLAKAACDGCDLPKKDQIIVRVGIRDMRLCPLCRAALEKLRKQKLDDPQM